MEHIFTILVQDFGKYDHKIIQLQLIKSYDENDELVETILIKYPDKDCFVPCSALLVDNKISLWAAMIGTDGDLMITKKEWLKGLRTMTSEIILEQWSGLLQTNLAA